MDWTMILTAILPSFTVTGGLAFFLNRKMEKTIKQAEATKASQEAEQSSVETQTQKLDLGDKYMELVNKIGDMIIENTELTKHGNGKLDSIEQRLSAVEQGLEKTERITGKLVEFENGKFQEFLKKDGKEAMCALG